MLFEDAEKLLFQEVRTLTALRLFHCLRANRLLHHSRWTPLDQRALAELLGTSQGNISKGLAELLGLGMLEKQRASGRLEWRLSPDFGWKGPSDEYWDATAHGRRKRFPPQPPFLRVVA